MAMESEKIEEIFAEEEDEVSSQKSSFLEYFYFQTFHFISSYGWFIVAVIALLLYIYKKNQPAILNWRQYVAASEESALHHRDADKFLSQQRAMEAARLRMQAEINQLSEVDKEKQKEREEHKRKQKIAEWDKFQDGGSFRSRIRSEDTEESAATPGTSNKPKSKGSGKSLRDDYNPLMGGASNGTCFRPTRRGGGGGGGA